MSLEQLEAEREAAERHLAALDDLIIRHPDYITRTLLHGDPPIPTDALARLVMSLEYLTPHMYDEWAFRFGDEDVEWRCRTLHDEVVMWRTDSDDSEYLPTSDLFEMDDAGWWAFVSIRPRHEQVCYLLLSAFV